MGTGFCVSLVMVVRLGVPATGQAAARAAPLPLYVAPNGNDQWSGRLPAPNAAGTDGPLATLNAARDAIHRARAAAGGALGPVTVRVRGGRYELETPLVFEPLNSGTADAPVVFEAYDNERPVFSGGRVIIGFRPNGPRWEADITEAKTGRWYFRQLWVNGQRRTRARAVLRRGRLPTELAEYEEAIAGPCPFRAGALGWLLDPFRLLRDGRRGHGLCHRQSFVLACAAVATLMASSGYRAYEDTCKTFTQRQLKAVGCQQDKQGRYAAPTNTTFFRVLSRLDRRRLKRVRVTPEQIGLCGCRHAAPPDALAPLPLIALPHPSLIRRNIPGCQPECARFRLDAGGSWAKVQPDPWCGMIDGAENRPIDRASEPVHSPVSRLARTVVPPAQGCRGTVAPAKPPAARPPPGAAWPSGWQADRWGGQAGANDANPEQARCYENNNPDSL